MKSINEIKTYLKDLDYSNLNYELQSLKSDKRKGVQNIISLYEKKYNNYLKELDRLENLHIYENECFLEGYEIIAGMDEVGRGPLAGPVVSCALILKRDAKIFNINDSKKLCEKKRNLLYSEIVEKSVDIGIGIVYHNIIDEVNIANATHKAMNLALDNLKVKAEIVLIDGFEVPNINIAQRSIIKGDSKSATIAAASIIAKVRRDEMMYKYHELYPQYGFDKNKGYGTQNHIEAIKKYGLCPIHRLSFVKNFVE